jgi:DNA primase
MPEGGIAEVKARLDIADVIRRYVDLRMAGGRLMGACPFHHETKPSFSVNPEEGFFYCFGCQASGDVIDFYGRLNGLEFKEALAQLADEAGVELKAGSGESPRESEKRRFRKRIFDMNSLAMRHFAENLRMAAGEIAREYLKDRGVSGEIARDFALGYSLDDWRGLERLLASKGFGRDEAAEAGLLVKKDPNKVYDRFRGRLMFPIIDLSGRVVAFGARTLTGDDPKYLNTSETDVYTKGDHLYGLSQARKHMTRSRTGVLTEGYTDVLSLHQFGFGNACGVLGTSLTANQVKRLAGFCNRVELVFDGDDAGRKAALRSAEMIVTRGLDCKVVLMPEGEDVDSLLQARGAEAFEKLLDEAPEGMDFCLRTVRDTFSPKEVMDWAGKFLRDLAREDMAAFFIPRIAAGLGLSERELRANLKPGRNVVRRERGAGSEDQKHEGPDCYRLGFFIRNPDYVGKAADKGLWRILQHEWARSLWDKIVETGVNQDTLPHLTEPEKRFWIQSRLVDGETPEKQEEIWRGIQEELETVKRREKLKSIREALQKAQDENDEAEIMRLLKERKEISGRLDE